MNKICLMLPMAIAAFAIAGCAPEKPVKAPGLNLEREAKSSVGSMLFNQQTHFLAKQAFASSFKDLKEDAVNTKDYSYRIVLKPNKFKGVAVTATSKNPKLRSYTGVVYVVNSKQAGNITLSQLCETQKPSKIAPIAPATPKRASDKLRCPAGSRSAFDLLASS